MNGHSTDAALGICRDCGTTEQVDQGRCPSCFVRAAAIRAPRIGNNVCLACKPPGGAAYWTCYCGTPAAFARAERERLRNSRAAQGLCTDCGKEPVNDPGERCPACQAAEDENENERAYERSLSDFYGGGGPRPIQEQHKQAWKEKRKP